MILKNGKVLNGDFSFCDCNLEIHEGKITDMNQHQANEMPGDFIDLKGHMVLPGLIDLHIHGCAGYDTMDGTHDALRGMSEFMAKNGVTSFLATTISESDAAIKAAVTNVGQVIEKGVSGANILGIAMEGPYFSESHKGAHHNRFLKNPSAEEFIVLNRLCHQGIKIVHVAPEKEGATTFIKQCTEKGIVVSLGHSGADYETALKAMEQGATMLTHVFNGMAGLHHRQPGLIGAALDKGKMVEMICDGAHLHPAIVRMIYKLFGVNQIVLISDSVRATGLIDGVYELGGQEMTVNGGIARMKDGALAGGTTTLLGCLKKAVEFGIPFEDAVKMATINPARVLGLEAHIGSIEKGKNADLIVLNEKLEVVETFIRGRRISF